MPNWNAIREKSEQKNIALERIRTLFQQADSVFARHPELSNRYVFLASKISQKYRITVPRELKRRMCKKCRAFLVPGKNARVRTKDGHVVITCLACKNMAKVPFVAERKKRLTERRNKRNKRLDDGVDGAPRRKK